MSLSAKTILDFWYAEPMARRWFNSTAELDREIRERFEPLWRLAMTGQLEDWRQTPEGVLALAIVFDQLPLNMYRGEARAFSSEALGIALAREAIERGLDRQLPPPRRLFLYMPLMHSERLADQDLSVEKFRAAGLDTTWPEHHREIVRRFGRFPHRNALLGRTSTPEEAAWLAAPGAFRG